MIANYTLYDIMVAPFITRFKALDGILAKLETHIEQHKLKDETFLNDRLYPDMFPFATQVRIATDMTKGAVARLSGVEVPKFEDNETTVAQLRTRVQTLIAFLGTLNSAQFEGVEDKEIHIKWPSGKEFFFTGLSFVNDSALPQVYFHLTAAYSILRHRGVVIGKADFLGA